MRCFVFRQLDSHYPIFPSEKDLLQAILGEGEQEDGGELGVLSEFARKQERLQAGRDLLPDLVEFYTWIHTNLSHLIRQEQASTTTIGQIITIAKKNMSKKAGKHLEDLYERVKDQYNCYVEYNIRADVCGAENEIESITYDTFLLHFLSGICRDVCNRK